MKQYHRNQLNNASISVLDSLPCSHGVLHLYDGSQCVRSGKAFLKIIVSPVAMFLACLENRRDIPKILNRPCKPTVCGIRVRVIGQIEDLSRI